jgi:parallel beta helix pectate lyase-like protein
MKCSALFLGVFGLLVVASLPTGSAHAQTVRTWVSGAGFDGNPCSQERPCQSFNYAMTQTIAGGEVHCVDSGEGGGPLTITKSITFDCTGALGMINFLGNSGITVNAGPTDKVILRNLTLSGFGNPMSGDAIRYVAGGALELDNVTINSVPPNFAGVNVATSGLAVLSVRNSSFSKMAVGIRLQATAPNIVASVTNTSFNNLTNTGIEVGANSYVGVSGSVFSAIYGNAINAKTSTSTVYASDNVFTNNNIGINAAVTGAKINAAGNKLFGNSKAFNVAAGATFLSSNDNRIDINPGNPPTGALTSR